MRGTSVLRVRIRSGFAALVLGASLWVGVRALARDFDQAFHVAGKSIYPPSVVLQIDAIRTRVPAGDSVLLVSASHTDGAWWARLLQRALYPRNVVVVRYEPLPPNELARLCQRWRFRHGLLLAPEGSSLALTAREDLGPLPALPDRVWLGRLSP